MNYKKLPIGIDGFEKIRTNDFYYVDKTMFIAELLQNWGEVNLFTRPRRFGKSLNMSMLKSFFEIGSAKTLFEGLKITQEKALCKEYMGKFPVISISLKSVDGLSFEAASAALRTVIGNEAGRFRFLLESDMLDEEDKNAYRRLIRVEMESEASYAMSDSTLTDSLKTLSRLLVRHYGRKVILLIDEYDVPLDKAFQAGYYEEMVSLIRNLFSNALKTNDDLQFSVLTGCLRISKESIFTGLNNLNVMTVSDPYFCDSFGFTDSEVKELLSYYGLENVHETVRDWYDGYQFGETAVYNPWSVINYVNSCYQDKHPFAKPYWSNTSSNSIVRKLIEHADITAKEEIERLIAGDDIEKPIHEDMTYADIDSTQNNLWNFLLFTGYLKINREWQEGDTIYAAMSIPNREVRYIYKHAVLRWFEERTEKEELSPLYESLLNGDTKTITKILSANLMETISFYDHQESYYHGFLTGMLKNMKNYIILSNRESGNGRPDILVKYPSVQGKAMIIEIKVAKSYMELETKCDEALAQIETMKYEYTLRQEGYQDILKYGAAFYRKECMVKTSNV